MKAVKRDWLVGKGASMEEAGEFVRTARRSSSRSAALSTMGLASLCLGGRVGGVRG